MKLKFLNSEDIPETLKGVHVFIRRAFSLSFTETPQYDAFERNIFRMFEPSYAAALEKASLNF